MGQMKFGNWVWLIYEVMVLHAPKKMDRLALLASANLIGTVSTPSFIFGKDVLNTELASCDLTRTIP